jgi:glycosyltransferase involved in cell wall biosynthesis
MKVAYISNLPFADADFPLVREMQRQGVDVYFFIYVSVYSHRATLVDIPEVYRKQGIFPATVYEEFKAYEGYMDMSKVFVVNSLHQSDFHPANIRTMLSLVSKIKKLGVDAVNITWPPRRNKMLLYLLRKKLVFTLHDPFPHSAKNNREFEFCRKLAFRWIPKIILLNDAQTEKFCEVYKFPRNRLFHARLGKYDCINYLSEKSSSSQENLAGLPESLRGQNYILFFGLIAPYKGVEFLLQAFGKLQQKHPDIKLLVAGSGKLYFDESLYRGNANVVLMNHYIPLAQLAGLLKNALFTVCPYKDATQSGVVQTAFSMGTPIVASDVGNFAKAIENGKSGVIVPPCDADALAGAMADLVEHPEKLESFRKYIAGEWLERNGWEEVVTQYLNCYEARV